MDKCYKFSECANAIKFCSGCFSYDLYQNSNINKIAYPYIIVPKNVSMYSTKEAVEYELNNMPCPENYMVIKAEKIMNPIKYNKPCYKIEE